MNSFQRVIQDVVDLAELQMQLLSVDSQEAKRKAGIILVCGGIATVLGGSAATTALIATGYILHDTVGWPIGVSMLASAGAAIAVTVTCLAIALFAFRSAAAALQETKSEFVENVKWLKATLVSPNTSPRNQLRSEDFGLDGHSGAGHDFNTNVASDRFRAQASDPLFHRK